VKLVTRRSVIGSLWLAIAISIVVLAYQGPAGWDTGVYWSAIKSAGRGGDPYAEGMAAQQAFHYQNHDPQAPPPMTYVYSPMTLPILAALGHIPAPLLATGYYIAIAGGFLLQLWSGWAMATPRERRILLYLLPLVAFFPGLLNEAVLLSGNIAYLLYGLILAAAVPGWRNNRWGWYCLAVLVASVCKAPLLSMLAFPFFLDKRQWLKVGVTGAIGTLLFACQSWLYPSLFADYLHAVNLQFVLNSDFGFSPAGLLGEALQHAGLPYSPAANVCYLLFAIAIIAVLWRSQKCIHSSNEASAAWLPVLLVGTVLLNPRIKEYDVAPLTIPMFLIAFRFSTTAKEHFFTNHNRRTPHLVWNSPDARSSIHPSTGLNWKSLHMLLTVAGWFIAINFAAALGIWKPIELGLLLLSFGTGTWMSHYRARTANNLVEANSYPIPATAAAPVFVQERL
jgi:hypothetical protein